MASFFFDRSPAPVALLAAVLLAGCSSELTCDDGTEFILAGVKTRYASQASLWIEDGTVVGITGQNDRGLSFSLRVPAGTDLMASASLDVATLADGLVYLECTGQVSPARCTTSEPQAMQMVARAGTVSIEARDKAVKAQFELSDVTVLAGSEGEAHGCFRVPDARAGAAGSAGAASK